MPAWCFRRRRVDYNCILVDFKVHCGGSKFSCRSVKVQRKQCELVFVVLLRSLLYGYSIRNGCFSSLTKNYETQALKTFSLRAKSLTLLGLFHPTVHKLVHKQGKSHSHLMRTLISVWDSSLKAFLIAIPTTNAVTKTQEALSFYTKFWLFFDDKSFPCSKLQATDIPKVKKTSVLTE